MAGFVLLYALWILTAASLLLALLAKQSRTVASASTAQLQEAVEFREALNAMDYVLKHTTASKVSVDPRLVAYREQVVSDRISDDNREKQIPE